MGDCKSNANLNYLERNQNTGKMKRNKEADVSTLASYEVLKLTLKKVMECLGAWREQPFSHTLTL